MTKAEERALERFPVHEGASKEWTEMHLKSVCTEYIEGYHQAEKDLELTWEDIREIYCTTLNLREHLGASVFGEPLYQEVLKRFKERKGK